MKKVVAIKRDVSTLYIYWVLTNACNYNCRYCPEHLKTGQINNSTYPTNENINHFIDEVIDKYLQGRFLSVLLSGGEPTLHPMFKTIVERMAPLGYVEVTTNGSQSIRWWQEMEVLPSKIVISLHPEFTNLDEINKLGIFLLKKNVKLNFNLMCDPKNWDWLDNIKTKLDESLQVLVNAKILVEHTEKVAYGKMFEYQSNQLHYIKINQSNIATKDARNKVNIIYNDGTHDTVLTDITNITLSGTDSKPVFTGWSCSAGKDGYMVTHNGIVKAGICGAGNLGKLDDFKPFDSNVTCVKNVCNFPKDLGLNKHDPTLLQDQ